MKEFIWKILHEPTGLFYCSRKGRWEDTITNLSEKGNFYTSEKVANKVLKEDCSRACINKAQTDRHNLEINPDSWRYNEAKLEDFKIVKYSLELVND